MSLEFTDDNFEAEVLKSDVPVLVDFWAPWCGPCKMIAPLVEELATEYQGKAKVGKLNTDDNQRVAMSYGVMSIPTLIIFKGGEPAERIVGVQPKAAIEAKLQSTM
jgi:thioredoxin 1